MLRSMKYNRDHRNKCTQSQPMDFQKKPVKNTQLRSILTSIKNRYAHGGEWSYAACLLSHTKIN
jgi:hypothetical protein